MTSQPPPSDPTPAPAGSSSGSAVLILPGRTRWQATTASDLDRFARDLLGPMKTLTHLDAIEVCRRDSNDLVPLPVAEPVSFLLNYVYARELTRRGVKIEAAAGYSLGEYAALVLANALDFETALQLVQARAEAIEQVIRKNPLRMVRVEGAEAQRIVELCEQQGDVWPATFDSPKQMVVGGEPAALDRVAPKFREAGAERIVLVLNNGGLHTPPMKEASDAIASRLAEATFKTPDFPVASSISAQIETEPDRWKELLSRQVHSPVRWQDAITALPDGPALVESAGDRLLELALTLQPGRKILVVDSMASIEATVAELTGA